MTYETDGQCDYIHINETLGITDETLYHVYRCPRTAAWLHLTSGLCYCLRHTVYISDLPINRKDMPVIEQQIEPEWEPL